MNVTHVPYRGTNAALADLIGGQIDAIFGEVSVMAPNVQSGKAVALAITSPERSKLLPSVPTMNEVGIAVVDHRKLGRIARAGARTGGRSCTSGNGAAESLA